ncbi:hypothetical protein Tco_1297191, partial [Tanacetum coccineum]
LVEAQRNGKVLTEEELKFLADSDIAEGPVSQSVITHNATYQADDLGAYDSDCDKISTAKAVLMANLSSYGSDALSEVPFSESTNNDMLNQSVQEMSYSKQTHLVNYPENEITSDSNIIPYSQYLLDTQNAAVQDTNSSAQQDAMILSVFEQLSEQYHIDKLCFEIQKKQFLIEYDRLLDQIISQDVVNIIVNSSMDVHTSVNVNSSVAMNDSVNYVEMCNKCLELEAELIKQHNMVEKDDYNRLSKRFSELEQHCVSLEIAMQLNKVIFQKNNTFVNQNEPSFDQLFELNNLKSELQEKDMTIKKLKERIKRFNEISTSQSVKKDFDEIETINIELEHRVTKLIAENEHLKQTYKQLYDSIKPSRVHHVKFKGKEIADNAGQMSKGATIAPGMYKLDLVILAPKVRNNREAHEYYLKHTMEQAAILRELIQELLGVKLSTSASGSKPSGNTKNDRISRTPSSNEKNKVEVQSRKVKSKLNKQNSYSKNVCNEHVKHPVKSAQALCSIKEWKSTGKVFNSVGYKWKPTGRTFTLVGNACPLTRITATNKVPLRVPIPLEVVAPEHVITIVYTRRPKVPKSVPNSKPNVAKSMTTNKMEPGTSQGSDTLVAPSSSSLIDCRLSKLFCGIWTLAALST